MSNVKAESFMINSYFFRIALQKINYTEMFAKKTLQQRPKVRTVRLTQRMCAPGQHIVKFNFCFYFPLTLNTFSLQTHSSGPPYPLPFTYILCSFLKIPQNQKLFTCLWPNGLPMIWLNLIKVKWVLLGKSKRKSRSGEENKVEFIGINQPWPYLTFMSLHPWVLSLSISPLIVQSSLDSHRYPTCPSICPAPSLLHCHYHQEGLLTNSHILKQEL